MKHKKGESAIEQTETQYKTVKSEGIACYNFLDLVAGAGVGGALHRTGLRSSTE